MNGLELFKVIILLKMIHIMSKQLQLQVYDEMLEEKNHVQNQLNHMSIENKKIVQKKKNENIFLTLIIDLIVTDIFL